MGSIPIGAITSHGVKCVTRMIMAKVGDAVIYVDQYGLEHFALLTAVWGEIRNQTLVENGVEREVTIYPSVNLVLVTPNEESKDQYGRQIVRETSVVHTTNQYAHGRYWKAIA